MVFLFVLLICFAVMFWVLLLFSNLVVVVLLVLLLHFQFVYIFCTERSLCKRKKDIVIRVKSLDKTQQQHMSVRQGQCLAFPLGKMTGLKWGEKKKVGVLVSSCRRGEAAKPDQIRWSSPRLSGNSFPHLSRCWGNLESLKVNLTPPRQTGQLPGREKERERKRRSDEEERKVKEGWRDQWVHLTPSLAQPTLISAKLSASN